MTTGIEYVVLHRQEPWLHLIGKRRAEERHVIPGIYQAIYYIAHGVVYQVHTPVIIFRRS